MKKPEADRKIKLWIPPTSRTNSTVNGNDKNQTIQYSNNNNIK